MIFSGRIAHHFLTIKMYKGLLVLVKTIHSPALGDMSLHSPELGYISISHQLLEWSFHATPVYFYFLFVTRVHLIDLFYHTEAFLCLVCHTCLVYC